VQSIRELGPLRGSILAGWRVLRCNPFSHGGVDELSDRKLFRGAKTRSERAARPQPASTKIAAGSTNRADLA
jgi:putative component of membrane protein insertase Oxa1/YidC/SpoIIIJ protein YidD